MDSVRYYAWVFEPLATCMIGIFFGRSPEIGRFCSWMKGERLVSGYPAKEIRK